MQVEGDSKVIIETAKGNMREGWAIKWVTNDIKYLLTTLNRFNLNHIFQEGNIGIDGILEVGGI